MIYKYIDRFATFRKFSRGQNDRGGADLALGDISMRDTGLSDYRNVFQR